ETGDDVSELDASIEGDEIEIAFNVKYMIDVLSVVGTPQVALDTTTPSSPGVLRPVGDVDFTHVIMPMHLGR
ncbi:MAG: DNA polymerase III subunit beta, partial [Anaerolineae bacterium]|nr:DNA polymerase III subunit beta [Anaerolineae bacterium]